MGSIKERPRAQSRMEKGGECIWKSNRMFCMAPCGRWRWGWGQLEESAHSLTTWECAASAPADRGPACRRETVPCAGQEGERSTTSPTERPWSWESDHPGYQYCEEAALFPWENYFTPLSPSLIHILLCYYMAFCLWIQGLHVVIA